MEFDTKPSDVSDVKWPTTTTVPGTEQPRRASGVGHMHHVGALTNGEVRTGRGGVDGARDDGPFQPERLGAQRFWSALAWLTVSK